MIPGVQALAAVQYEHSMTAKVMFRATGGNVRPDHLFVHRFLVPLRTMLRFGWRGFVQQKRLGPLSLGFQVLGAIAHIVDLVDTPGVRRDAGTNRCAATQVRASRNESRRRRMLRAGPAVPFMCQPRAYRIPPYTAMHTSLFVVRRCCI